MELSGKGSGSALPFRTSLPKWQCGPLPVRKSGKGVAKRTFFASETGKSYQRFTPVNKGLNEWWACSDLNRGPSDYESPALTAELWARCWQLLEDVLLNLLSQACNARQGGPALTCARNPPQTPCPAVLAQECLSHRARHDGVLRHVAH